MRARERACVPSCRGERFTATHARSSCISSDSLPRRKLHLALCRCARRSCWWLGWAYSGIFTTGGRHGWDSPMSLQGRGTACRGAIAMARNSTVPWIPCHGPRVSRCCDEALWSDRCVNLPDGLCPVDRMPVDQRGLEAPQFEKQAVLRRLGTRSRFLSKQEWRRVRLEGPPRKSQCAHHTQMPAHAVRPCRGWVHAKCGAHVNDACRVRSDLPVPTGC